MKRGMVPDCQTADSRACNRWLMTSSSPFRIPALISNVSCFSTIQFSHDLSHLRKRGWSFASRWITSHQSYTSQRKQSPC